MATNRATLPSTREIKLLQGRVRAAINYFPPGERDRREGVAPEDLRKFIRWTVEPQHDKHITLRRVTGTRNDEPEYALRYAGQLLFRLLYVPWTTSWKGEEFADGGRWHVRRHPQATWWREGPGRRGGRRRV